MTDRIFYKQSNGKIAMLSPSENVTLEQILNDMPEIEEYLVVEEENVPSPTNLLNFFDALTMDVERSLIDFDISIAREITKDRLRREREPLFVKNDILIRDAQIENDAEKLAEGIAERNRLRDITLLPDSITSLDELRSLHL